ncbi:MAG: NAD(P)/FAD-dependent oxidoreductase [Sandaracinaceae bacterium]
MHVVIVGNGVAGIEAALAVRARESTWTITIVSEESDHFFSRTALMWVFTGQLSHACIEPHERDLYTRMGFRRVRARATGIDAAQRRLQLAGRLDPLPFDRLLIACGSRARTAPWSGAELAGVGHFVTHQDLAWLEGEVYGGPSRGGAPPNPDGHLGASAPDSPYRRRAIARARRGRAPTRPAVIGGGLIGIEAVEILVHAGLRPTFFIREEHFWPIALDAREAGWIADRMREHGVDVRLGEEVTALEGDGAIETVRTDAGEHPCDLCVVAIGVVPNTDWLDGGPIARDEGGGILVDGALRATASAEHVRSSSSAGATLEGIFAAGDCASVEWADGSRRPEPLWYTARDQGRIAARGLLGDGARYDRGVWYNSAKLMDVEYTTVGLVNMLVPDERNWFFEERGAVRSTTRIVLSGDRVVGFNLLGRRWDHEVLIRWIEEHRSLDFVRAHLNDASFDTELVPRLVLAEGELGGEAPSPISSGMPAPVV